MNVELAHPLQRAPAFQQRSELGEIRHWWSTSGEGVCALVGLGGAGKTALAERFISLLPNVIASSIDVQTDGTLPAPESVFVYSFYAEPHAETFFARVACWLKSESYRPDSPQPSHFEVMSMLRRHTGRALLVLDGLERAQHDGTDGAVFGDLNDRQLRDLVTRAGAGHFAGVGFLITSRFPIAPLEEEQPPAYRRIDVEELLDDDAIALLEKRGVRGTREELSELVEACGSHALSLDLVAGYIATFGGGDPKTRLMFSGDENLEETILSELNPAKRRVMRLQLRFRRIADRYREQLLARDPECWAVMRLACLFRDGVQSKTLLAIRILESGFLMRVTLLGSIEDTTLDQAVQLAVAGHEAHSMPDTVAEALSTSDERVSDSERWQRLGDLARVYEESRPDTAAPKPTLLDRLLRLFHPRRAFAAAAAAKLRAPSIPTAHLLAAVRPNVREISRLYRISFDDCGVASCTVELVAREPVRVEIRTDNLGVRGALDQVREKTRFATAARRPSEDQQTSIRKQLEFLRELRLLDVTSHEGVVVHPAIRAGFIDAGDGQAERSAHRRAATALTGIDLEGIPVRSRVAFDSVDVVYHLIEAGAVSEAWSLYRHTFHGFLGLGMNGDFARGERTCRLFARGRRPGPDALPSELSRREQISLLNEWGLYLNRLGQLDEAIDAFEAATSLAHSSGRPHDLARLLQNLADALEVRGRLADAKAKILEAAEILDVAQADKTSVPTELIFRESWRELIPDLIRLGLELEVQSGQISEALPPLDSLDELLRGERWTELERACRTALRGAGSYRSGSENSSRARILIHLSRAQSKLHGNSSARVPLATALAWALDCGDREVLTSALLQDAELAMQDAREASDLSAATKHRDEALERLAEVMRLADECGYSIAHVDALIARAELSLLFGALADAVADIQLARDGVESRKLFGIEASGYRLGALKALELMSRIFEQKAASCVEGSEESLSMARRARDEIAQALQLTKRLKGRRVDELKQRDKSLQLGKFQSFDIWNQPAPPAPKAEAPSTSSVSQARDEIFVSYSRHDERALEELLRTLKPAVRNDRIRLWTDREIQPGDDWRQRIEAAMSRACVAVFLVSPNFLSSDFIVDHELTPFTRAAEAQKVRILWVPLSASLYDETPLVRYQAAHDPRQPLDTLSDGARSQAWVAIAQTILSAKARS